MVQNVTLHTPKTKIDCGVSFTRVVHHLTDLQLKVNVHLEGEDLKLTKITCCTNCTRQRREFLIQDVKSHCFHFYSSTM